jgi:HlyD family secretion protein
MSDANLAVSVRQRVGKPRPRKWHRLGLAVVVPIAVIAYRVNAVTPSPGASPAPSPVPRAVPARVSALGRLAPEGEVVSVASPTLAGNSAASRVDQLLVAVGDEVKAGQIVAILDTQHSRRATVLEAKAKVEIAKAKLTQVEAGSKPEDIKVQEAMIRRSEVDLLAAQEDFDRVNRLADRNAASKEEYAASRHKLAHALAELEYSKTQLKALKAIRQVDVKAAMAEVASADAGLAVAQEDLKNTEVRAPLSGRVLCIRARPGERVGDHGILDVGNTEVMQVVAEIYEEDVSKLRIGQPAKVRVLTSGEELAGAVVSKDLIVSRKVIFSNDPVADIDARVIEVRIRLNAEDGAKVAGLSNARVDVVIDVRGKTK